MNNFKKEKENLEKQNKDMKTATSQQSLANQLVLSSMPSNPNAGVIQQNPAKQ